MIYDLTHTQPFAFVHLPRTAGTSMVDSIARALPRSNVDNYGHKHSSAWKMINRWIGFQAWWNLFRFTIIRNPWDVVASLFVRAQKDAQLLNEDPTIRIHSSIEWVRLCRQLAGWSFHRFVTEKWAKAQPMRGGYYVTGCTAPDGSGLGVEAITFETLTRGDGWPMIVERLGLPEGTELARLNGATPEEAGVPEPEWTDELITIVGDRCHRDIELFGWEAPSTARETAGIGRE